MVRLIPAFLLLTSCTPTGPGKADTGGVGPVDADGDGVPEGEDCDDTNAAVGPEAPEICDELDNDCDGEIDEGVQTTVYGDGDGDGHGRTTDPRQACAPGEGEAATGDDCDDADPTVHPGAEEECDERDNDCDGEIDEGTIATVYPDDDGDGYGDPSLPTEACGVPEGFVDNDDDCDDATADARPDGIEQCDGIDNDCDGFTDEDESTDARTFYADIDGDGYGDPDNTTLSCEVGAGYVDQARDCDDQDPDINPDASEVCDGIDNDCDALTDDADPTVDPASGATWYADGDGDSYGDATSGAWSCFQPSGTVADATDCDDGNEDVNPGEAEICNGGIDDDCSGDADDADAGVDLSTGSTWYADDDGDGHGDPADSVEACAQPTGHVADDTDCDDGNEDVNPGGTEICNGGLDDDCDGDADDADSSVDLSTGTDWFADDDNDDYGDSTDSITACDQPTGRVEDDTDCDDGDGDVNPGETEVWYDGVDADCGLDDDYDADGDGARSYAEAGGTDCADDDASVTDCGSDASSAGESCASILDSDTSLGSGAYWIDPDGSGAFQVDCDMTSDGGGWIELELDHTDATIVYQYSTTNPWRKCADNAAQYFNHLGSDSSVAVDGNVTTGTPVDISLSFLQPSTGVAYTATQADALRSIVSELHPDTRMVALTADDDGGSWQDGDGYGHEVYASDSTGAWTVLTPGTNGECGGSVSWPQSSSRSAYYFWSTDAGGSGVAGTTGMTSGMMPALSPDLVLPVQVRAVVATGGGVAFGWEEEIFLVR